MKTRLFAPLVVLSLAVLVVSGCYTTTRRPLARSYAAPRQISYALAVSVHGGLQPTPGQWAALQKKFAKELAAVGALLVTDIYLADRIIRVDFFPDETDAEGSGRAVIVSVRSNNLTNSSSSSALAFSGGRYPTTFGFGAGFLSSLYGFDSSSYYGYGNAYYDGYTYATPTLNPRKPVPPTPVTPPGTHPHPGHRNHPPGEPVRCPPLLAALPVVQPAALDRVAYPPSEGRTATFPDGLSRLGSTRSYASSDRPSTHTDRTPGYTRSEPTSSQSDRSSSWFGRMFSSSDSGNSGNSGSHSSYSSNRTTTEYTAASAERPSSHSDRSYSRNESSYSKSDSSYSKSDSSSASSSNSNHSSSYSHSSPSYSPPSSSSSSYSAPSYSPPAPSYSPPSAPTTTEVRSTQVER